MATVNAIVSEIKFVNDTRLDGSTMAQDQSNEALLGVFRKLGVEVEDDEKALCDRFGLKGFHAIRDAEQGIYP